MKKNKVSHALAAMLVLAAFFLPLAAYAEPMTEDQPESDAALEILGDDTDRPDLEGTEAEAESIVQDEEDLPSESAIPDGTKEFTPDGQATVVDLAYESDGKMFYTFKTSSDNVFYLVIDRERKTDNVYFLNAVTEEDLLALAEAKDKKGAVSTSAVPVQQKVESEPVAEETQSQPEGGDAPAPTSIAPKKSNQSMLIFLLIGAVVFGGVAYYFKIVRPKQQSEMDDEDEESANDEGDGKDMEFEDESEETDGAMAGADRDGEDEQ